MKSIEELKSWFEDDKLYVGEYVRHKISQLDEPEVLSQEEEQTPETVADVMVDYLIASAKLKLALSMEVEELKE